MQSRIGTIRKLCFLVFIYLKYHGLIKYCVFTFLIYYIISMYDKLCIIFILNLIINIKCYINLFINLYSIYIYI